MNKLTPQTETLGKLPPQSVDIEETIIGAILLESGALDKVKDIITSKSFYRDAHRIIFEAMEKMKEEGTPIDIKTTVHQLRKAGQLEVIGGAYYIAELTSKVNSAANIETHARIVAEQHIKRSLIMISGNLQNAAYKDTTDTFELLTQIKGQIAEIDEETIKSIKNQNALIKIKNESLIDEFEHGKEIGEDPRVNEMRGKDGNLRFAWKRGFLNCWTGWPNDGKTQFFSTMSLTMSIKAGWKWAIFSPEMYSSKKLKDGTIETNANDIIDDLVFTMTGKTPYKHYNTDNRLDMYDYLEAVDKVKNWFHFINPADRDYKNIIDVFRYYHGEYGIDGFLIDPFKNVRYDMEVRSDIMLDRIFDEFKQLTLDTNTSMNFIAHPRSVSEPKNSDGSYKIVTQWMLLGGAAWNNGMDGIFSINRPNKHVDSNDPGVHFYNLKQRKQQLVARTGVIEDIMFNWKTNRYYFGGVCPIDGEIDMEFRKPSKQVVINYSEPGKENEDLPF